MFGYSPETYYRAEFSRRSDVEVLNDSLPPLECLHVLLRQKKPFSFAAFVGEPLVPVRLYSNGVIGFDAVNSLRRNWNLYGQLAAPATNRICAPDFVVRPRFHKVDKFGREFRFRFPLCRFGVCRLSLTFGTEEKDIFKSTRFATMCCDSFDQLVFSTEPAKHSCRN